MAFPEFSNFKGYVQDTILKRKEDYFKTSGLNCFIKISSGGNLSLVSNPSAPLFTAAGDNSATIYGNKTTSGIIGTKWDGKTLVSSGPGSPGRPTPIVTSLEIDEGAGELSRKAKFTIRCFSIEQLNSIMSYYLEPGFTIFIEMGWNVAGGVKVLNKLSAASIAAYQNQSSIDSFRANSGGQAEVYLGFVTGGNVSVSETYWDVNVKCSGFSELPAYLMAADNQKNKGAANESRPEVDDYPVDTWWGGDNLPQQRWRAAFNNLPSNKKTKLVKALEGDDNIANPVNFINFDEKVKNDINSKKDGGFWGNLFGADDDVSLVSEDGQVVDINLPDGVKLVGEERFIRMGTLMAIMNRLENVSYKVGGSVTIPFKIATDRTICSAFDKIFSTDRTKLFIPNKNTPGPSYYEIATGGDASKTTNVDNRVSYGGKTVAFPSDGAVSGGKATNSFGQTKTIFFEGESFNKKARTWGFLDDLYVNFDFAKGIFETKNFLIKDALYQLLNGMSSAAGGMWDFQIIEHPNPTTKVVELMVVEMNAITSSPKPDETLTLQMAGPESVFLEASFDMDMGGAIMNQVMGEKNSGTKKSLNSSSPSVRGNLFSEGASAIKDEVGVVIAEEAAKGKEKWSDYKSNNEPGPEGQTLETEDKKFYEEKFAQFLGKVCLCPRVDVTEGKWKDNPYESNYLCAYDDQAWFEAFKIGEEPKDDAKVSVLLPIKFTFTIHGVSGIKRGDKFKVLGLPAGYSTKGFFQVTGIKQVVSGMLWKTEVIGQFRQTK